MIRTREREGEIAEEQNRDRRRAKRIKQDNVFQQSVARLLLLCKEFCRSDGVALEDF